MADGHLSHAEIWDDSALVKSWNEALEEYKKYHSLAARGEDVDAVLDQIENGERGRALKAPAPPDTEPARAKDTARTAVAGATAQVGDATPGPPGRGNTVPVTAAPATGTVGNVPQTLIGQVQDSDLRNVMMSWYYAGYYTGLYEGQQKAWAEMQNG